MCSLLLYVQRERICNLSPTNPEIFPRDERICTVCDSGEGGDEFHYLLNCFNENVKRKYVDKYYTHHPNVPKFCRLVNITSKSKTVKLAKFITCIFELF